MAAVRLDEELVLDSEETQEGPASHGATVRRKHSNRKQIKSPNRTATRKIQMKSRGVVLISIQIKKTIS